MGWLSAIPALSKIVDKGLDIVDQFVEDKDQANKLKTRIKQQIEDNTHEKDIKELSAKTKILLGEVKGGWLQRNWRPLTMMSFVLIVVNNYIVFPYASMFTDNVTVLEFPPAFWGLLTTGIGGYIGAKSYERLKGKRPEQEQNKEG